MADAKRTVEIFFVGNDELSKTIKGIESSLSGFADAAQPLANIADSVLKLNAAFGALAAAGLAYAYKKSVEFEDTLVGLNKVLGDTENIDTATAAVAELSSKYGVAQGALIESTTAFKQAGFDLSDSLKLVNSAQELVIAGDVEAAAATETLVRILKGYRLEADSSRSVVELLNYASNNFATTSGQLAEALARSAGQSAQAGLSFREASQYLTPIVEVFQDGQMAGTAFGTTLLRLKDQSDNVTEAFQILGFSTEENLNRPTTKTADILKRVSEQWGTVSENQKDYVANLLFGKEQAGKMIVALEGMSKAEKLVTASSNELANALDKEINTRLQSSSIIVQKFQNDLENLSIAIGDKFKASANEAVSGLSSITNAIKQAVDSGAFDQLFKALEEFNKDLGKRFEETAKILPEAFKNVDFGNITQAFENLKQAVEGAFQGVFAGIDLSTADGISEAIQLIVDSFESLINVASGIIDSWTPFITAVSEAVQWFNQLDSATKQSIGTLLGLAQQVTVAVGGAVAFSAAIKGIALALSGPVGVAVAVGTATTAFISFGYVLGQIPQVAEKVQGLFEKIDESLNFTGKTRTKDELFVLELAFEKAKKQAQLTAEKIKEIDKEIKPVVDISSVVEATQSTRELKNELDNALKHQSITVDVETDKAKAEYGELVGYFKGKAIYLPVETNAAEAKKKIEDVIDPTKKYEIEVGLKKAQLEKDAETIKANFEYLATKAQWQAELDIAKVEAAASVINKAFEGVQTVIDATSSNIAALFGGLQGADYATFNMIKNQLDIENKLRQEAFDLQKRLTEEQIAYLEARRKKLEEGNLITVQADGLKPALEMIFHEVLLMTQIRASEDGLDFLLGLT